MLEIIVFAVVLVAAQIIGGFVIMNLMMSEKFLKYYTKKMIKLMKDFNEEFDDIMKEL